MARIPLATDLKSRDGTLAKAPRVVNGYVEQEGKNLYVFSRPGTSLVDETFATFGSGLWAPPRTSSVFDGLSYYSVNGTTVSSTSSAAVPTYSVSTNFSLPTGMDAAILLSFGGSLYAISPSSSSTSGDVYRRSTLGGSWTLLTSSGAFAGTATCGAVHGGLMWLGGNGLEQYYSADGVTWTAIDLTGFTGTFAGAIQMASFGGALWLWGTETYAFSATPTTAASWAGGATTGMGSRSVYGLTVQGNAVYIAGGQVSSARTDDVLRSTNGIAFTNVTSAPGWVPRYSPTFLSYNGTLIVADGDTNNGVSDVWTSANNGVTWTQAATGLSSAELRGFGVVWGGRALIAPDLNTGTGLVYYPNGENPVFTNTVIGSIATDGEMVSFASNDAGTQVFIKSNSAAYTYNGSSLTRVTDGQYPTNTVRGAPYLNGIFYVMDTDGNIWGSAEDDPTSWTADNVVVAEFEPDGGVCLAKMVENIVALGTYTTELFFDAGNATGSALSPVQSAPLLIGCAHENSVAQTESALMWVAQQKAQGTNFHKGRFVVVMQGVSYQRISTPDVERILDADDFSEVYADVLTIAGHMFYVLTLLDSGITLAYDFKEKAWYPWTRLSDGTAISISALSQSLGVATATSTSHGLSDGDPITVSGAAQAGYNLTTNITRVDANTFTYPVDSATVTPATGTISGAVWTSGPFDLAASCNFAGIQIAQFRESGKVFSFAVGTTTDGGDPIDFQIVTDKVDGGSNDNKFMSRLEVIGDKVDSIGLIRYSDDDYVSFSKYRRLDMDAERTATTRLGKFRRRAFQFRHTRSAALRLEALEPTVE